MAVKPRFTRIPKVCDLISAGVPTEAIPTYCALADFSNNKTGLCWPRMETLARRLSRSPRTIQRHLHLLKEKGLVQFVERKRDRQGRFGAYVYRLVHVAALTATGGGREERTQRGGSSRRRGSKKRPATGHAGPVAPNKGQTRRQEDSPQPPKGDPKEGYWRLFGEKAPPGGEERARQEAAKRREEAARRRREGYDWLF
ncbi:MAG: helix-turn-helix domain-containing protein [Actinomycetota bacterium]|nr:helix-turn-helix domain-containing protein [Actinomycetota bacterium]